MNQTPEVKPEVPKKGIDKSMKIGIAIIVAIVLATIAIIGVILTTSDSDKSEDNTQEDASADEENNVRNNIQNESDTSTVADETEPPLKLKSIGFNLASYDPETNKAGDIEFTRIPLQFDQIFSPFGQQDPRTTDPNSKNPQPTVILPLGTKVLSLVDGVVVDVKEIYSGDWTIMVGTSENSRWVYETEHVDNPVVSKGDRVTAGQVIAEVSSYDTQNHPGFGKVEIGILHASIGSNPPEHVCPFQYMDESIKNTVNEQLIDLYEGWEVYLGKDIYDEETFVSPGCVVETPVKS